MVSSNNKNWESAFYEVADSDLQAMFDALPDELKTTSSFDEVVENFFSSIRKEYDEKGEITPHTFEYQGVEYSKIDYNGELKPSF